MLTILAAILAISISSDKIDTFMHLPDWFPTSVDAEHTFGSDEHTNATHRTTLDTLAAVESVFEAYHERVFYASEGRSNDWDRAVYGPRPTDLQLLWFTNTDHAVSCFVYPSWTNDWQRATPDSRRLVEFDNLFDLSRPYLTSLFRRMRVPFLDKGDTWGLRRDVMFGSSWGPTNSTLPSIGWTENESFRPDLAASCVPLCYCATDSVFNASSPSADGFLYEVLKGLDSNFNALYRIEGGPWPEYSVRTNGWLAEWHDSGKWKNSVAAKTSVPGIITNNFPLSGPEEAMTILTRRLVPDDFIIVNVTNVDHIVNTESFEVDIDSIYERPRRYMTGPDPGYRESDFVDAWMTSESTYDEYGQKIIRIHYNLEYVDPYSEEKKSPDFLDPDSEHDDFYFPEPGSPDGGCDRVDVKIEGVPYFFYGFDGPYYVDDDTYYYDGYPTTYGGDFKYSGEIDFIKIEVVTTSVQYASSLLATESRALAMLDRTYEIPRCVVPTNIPMTATERDTTRKCESSLLASGSTEVSVQIEYPFTPLPETIYIRDLLGGEYDPDYSTTNIYSSLAYPTVIRRRLSDVSDTASGGFIVTAPGGLPNKAYTVGDLKAALADNYGWQTWMHDNPYRITRIHSYDYGYCTGYVEIWDEYSGGYGDTHWFDLTELIPESPVTLDVGASVSIERSATVFISGVPSLLTFDRMYPWYGPGPYGYSNGTVGESRVLFAEEVLSLVSRYSDFDWKSDPISLPLSRFQSEIDDPMFDWKSWHMIAVSNPTGSGSGLQARAYQETSGSLQSKVDSEFRAEVGSYSTAESLIPATLDAAYLSAHMTGFNVSFGGETMTNELTFVINGPLPSDVSVRDGSGRELPDDAHLVGWRLVVSGYVDGDVYFNPSYAKNPVAVDGRLSPVIVTDWNWKALKTERNDQ